MEIYHTEYGPFIATDWLKQKEVGGLLANDKLYFVFGFSP